MANRAGGARLCRDRRVTSAGYRFRHAALQHLALHGLVIQAAFYPQVDLAIVNQHQRVLIHRVDNLAVLGANRLQAGFADGGRYLIASALVEKFAADCKLGPFEIESTHRGHALTLRGERRAPWIPASRG